MIDLHREAWRVSEIDDIGVIAESYRVDRGQLFSLILVGNSLDFSSGQIKQSES